MKLEEFAFLNQQLAAMLRSGIPLEGALRRLVETMQTGPLRAELERLGADLEQGVPLREAVSRRELPDLYVRMLQIGPQSQDLPGILTLLADHYRRVGNLWTRLKALMVYPVIVYVFALMVMAAITRILSVLTREDMFQLVQGGFYGTSVAPTNFLLIWLPVFWFAALGGLFALAVLVPASRDWLRWRLPGFKEAHLARFASTMRLLLHAGTDLPQALKLARGLEGGNRIGREIQQWEGRLADGEAKLGRVAQASIVFPPLFTWLVSEGGADLADGFGRAAETFGERAQSRIEMLLHAALPVAVLVLGLLIVAQLTPVARSLILMLNMLGDVGGMD
jgi:type II secretory pathway component PulF